MNALTFDAQVRQQRGHPQPGSRIPRHAPDVVVTTLTDHPARVARVMDAVRQALRDGKSLLDPKR
jgi:hypothetical protein